MRCPKNTFQFGCICVQPHGISKPNVVQSRAQGMKGIGELRNFCAPLLPYCGPSHVPILIVSNMVILFLYHIHKKIPSGLSPIYSRLLYGNFLPVNFPPMFCMGGSLTDCEGDHFFVEENMNREITF
jgi:hypothetical protein